MFIIPIGSMPSLEAIGESQKIQSQPQALQGIPFADTLRDAMQTYQESQALAAQDTYDLAMGKAPDLHSIMIHSAMESTAMETVVQLTSRAVSSYKEIMQMQV